MPDPFNLRDSPQIILPGNALDGFMDGRTEEFTVTVLEGKTHSRIIGNPTGIWGAASTWCFMASRCTDRSRRARPPRGKRKFPQFEGWNMTRDWTDRIVGARMSVDSDFSSRIDNSQFSRQEWGLIMTAVEFRIEHAEDPSRARLVADTSRIQDIMPEVERAAEMQGRMGGMGGNDPSRGGVLGSLRDALGFGSSAGSGGSVDPNRVAAATSLVEAYTTELQSYLEKQDRWEEVRLAASESE